jgi:hypothetical protein
MELLESFLWNNFGWLSYFWPFGVRNLVLTVLAVGSGVILVEVINWWWDKFCVAAVLALVLATSAFAQDDFFPPSGIYIPCCNGGGSGHTGGTYGRTGASAWTQVLGAGPGDVVTFQYVLDSRSAGSLHSLPASDGVTDMTYLGDPNNPYEKWYWNTFGRRDKGGEFCISCPWRFTVPPGVWNPWIYVLYFDSGDGWDVDLYVTNIRTPVSFTVVTEAVKNTASSIGDFFVTFQNASGEISRALINPPYNTDVPHSAVFALLSYAASKFASGSYRIANDPYDGDYCSPTGEWIDPQLQADIEWVRQYDTASGGWLVESTPIIEAFLRRAATSADRALSAAQDGNMDCAWARRYEVYWNLNQAGRWMWEFRQAVAVTADRNPDMDAGARNSLYWSVDWMANVAAWLEGLQP